MAGYGRKVFENTEAFLTSLKDGDLDRELNLKQFGFPMDMTVGNFLSRMVLGNTYAHTGEISALKGTMGLKGYPF